MRRAGAVLVGAVALLLGCGGLWTPSDPCSPAVVRTEQAVADGYVRVDAEDSVWDLEVQTVTVHVVDRQGRLVTRIVDPMPDGQRPEVTREGAVRFAHPTRRGWTHCVYVAGLPRRCIDGDEAVDKEVDREGRLVALRSGRSSRAYTWEGDRVVQEVHDAGESWGGVATHRYRYDRKGRLRGWSTERPVPSIDEVYRSDSEVVARHGNGMPAEVVEVGRDLQTGEPDPQHSTQRFGFDPLGRPTSYAPTYGTETRWAYTDEGFVAEELEGDEVLYREERAGGRLVAVHRGQEHGNDGPVNRYEVVRRGEELCIGPLQKPEGGGVGDLASGLGMLLAMLLGGGGGAN